MHSHSCCAYGADELGPWNANTQNSYSEIWSIGQVHDSSPQWIWWRWSFILRCSSESIFHSQSFLLLAVRMKPVCTARRGTGSAGSGVMPYLALRYLTFLRNSGESCIDSCCMIPLWAIHQIPVSSSVNSRPDIGLGRGPAGRCWSLNTRSR